MDSYAQVDERWFGNHDEVSTADRRKVKHIDEADIVVGCRADVRHLTAPQRAAPDVGELAGKQPSRAQIRIRNKIAPCDASFARIAPSGTGHTF